MLESELEVIADLEVEGRGLAHLAHGERVVGTAVGRLRMREVGQGRGEGVAALLDRGQLGLHPLELGRHPLDPLDHLAGVLAGPLARRDLVRGRVLGGPAALDLRQQLAPAGVEGEQLVEGLGGTAPLQRGPGGSRVLANRAQVEHLAGAAAR